MKTKLIPIILLLTASLLFGDETKVVFHSINEDSGTPALVISVGDSMATPDELAAIQIALNHNARIQRLLIRASKGKPLGKAKRKP